jgi:hypothetical protein
MPLSELSKDNRYRGSTNVPFLSMTMSILGDEPKQAVFESDKDQFSGFHLAKRAPVRSGREARQRNSKVTT